MEYFGIICAGHLIVDTVKIIESWPSEGMLVSIESEQQHGGGLVYNCLCDLAKLDPKIDLHAIGVTGHDQYGEYVIRKLSEKGINCTHITALDSIPTSFTDVMSVKNGQRTFFHMEGANAKLDIHHIVENNLRPKIFHLGYLALLKTLDQEDKEYGTRAAKVLNIMRNRGCKTSLDLVSVKHPNFATLVQAALPYTDYLIINEIEAGMATELTLRDKDGKINQKHVEIAAKRLLSEGVQELIIIHFPEGAYGLTTKCNETFVPSFKIQKELIKGTVGAGDAFCAGALYSLHEGFDLEQCIRFANAVARFSLLHETSTEGIVNAKETLRYISKAKETVQTSQSHHPIS